jgi:hypothetical protein
MKKKLIVGIAVVFTMSLAIAGLSFAAEGYGAAGCGLGSMFFGDKPGFIQVFAATTNGTAGNQTFGITSGTSNCEKQPKFASSERLNEFVLANMDNLAKEVAIGQGESLDTLAELMGIAADKRPSVYAKLQMNFSNIFTSEKVVSADVIDNIIAVING